VSEQAILEMLGKQWLPEERVIAQVDHAGAEVIASPPVGIHFAKLFGGKSELL
jgi:hypothetical protein